MRSMLLFYLAAGMAVIAYDAVKESHRYKKLAENDALKAQLATEEFNAAFKLLTEDEKDQMRELFHKNEIFYMQVRHDV